ncbi:hypothetical protein [Synechococcus sp. M16CYN]
MTSPYLRMHTTAMTKVLQLTLSLGFPAKRKKIAYQDGFYLVLDPD